MLLKAIDRLRFVRAAGSSELGAWSRSSKQTGLEANLEVGLDGQRNWPLASLLSAIRDSLLSL